MDFWNTILGEELARTLCRTLPHLAEMEMLKERKQYTVSVQREVPDCNPSMGALSKAISDELQKKGTLLDHVLTTDQGYLLVFSKPA